MNRSDSFDNETMNWGYHHVIAGDFATCVGGRNITWNLRSTEGTGIATKTVPGHDTGIALRNGATFIRWRSLAPSASVTSLLWQKIQVRKRIETEKTPATVLLHRNAAIYTRPNFFIW